MPFNFWDIGGCNCTSTCTQTFAVAGCRSLPYPGLAVEVYTAAGGTLLASGTTDMAGSVALSWPGTSGTYWVAVTGASTRFAAFARSMALACGGSTSIALVPASGYHCGPTSCLLPLKDTLFLASAVLGDYTLGYDAGVDAWTASTSYSYPACPAHGCAALTIPIAWSYSGTTVSLDGYIPTAGLPPYCPIFDAGPGVSAPGELASGTGTFTCPPAFLFGATLPAAAQNSWIYCDTDDVITITE